MIRVFSQYVSAKSILLMVLEGLLIGLSLLCAAKVRFWTDAAEFSDYTSWPSFGAQAAALVAVFQICFYYNDLYDLSLVRQRSDLIVRMGQSLGAASLILGGVFFLAPPLMVGRGVFFVAMAFVMASTVLNRIVLDRAWTAAAARQNILLLGAGEMALTLAKEFTRRADLNVRIVGMVGDGEPRANSAQPFAFPVLGGQADLEELVARHRVSKIVLAMQDYRGALPVSQLVTLRVRGVEIEDAHSAIAALTGRVWLNTIRASWFIFSNGFGRSRATLALKRALDILLAAAGLIAGAPLMLAAAILVPLDSPGPALFRQRRVGLGGRTFDVLKFRSMRAGAEANGAPQWASVDDPRVTRVGKHLRRYRIDELPQFFNVLAGEMSFVGPRPERPEFVARLQELIPYYNERHSVPPGLTGWAQIQYPYGASVEDAFRKLEFDLFYLKHMSILFDCAIVLQTVRTVLFRQGSR